MKFTTTLIAVALATSVTASAVPQKLGSCFRVGQICSKEKRNAEADAQCWRVGQICSKVKRAAEAFAEAVASDEIEARCTSLECFEARLKTRELADLVAMTVRHTSPEAYIQSLNLRDVDELRRDLHEARAADAKADAAPQCWRVGQICSKEKRAAEADAQCWRVGQICSKAKRAAEAVAEAVAAPQCWRVGQICSKEKRDAEATAEALPQCWRVGQICSKEKRDAEAAANAQCWRVGQICSKAKRDALALAAAADDILMYM